MTIKDIARKAGVSTATVSYVINKTRHVSPERTKRVMDVLEETGYQPDQVAKTLRTGESRIIGVLVEDVLAFSSSRIINGISEHIESTDYRILLSDLRMLDNLRNQYDQIVYQKEKVNKALSDMVYGERVDALIYIGTFDRDISDIISNMKRPTVIAYSTAEEDEHLCSVTYENEAISAEVASHLIDAGHTQIAVITGLIHTTPAQTRLKGIKQTVKERGLTLDPNLVKHGDWERESGYLCMQDILKAEKEDLPTAVLAMNDLMAIGAMDAIREANLRVPEDISVVGFDTREASDLVFPRLTTVEIDLKEVGLIAAQMVIEKLKGNGKYVDERNVVVPSRLIRRDTVMKR